MAPALETSRNNGSVHYPHQAPASYPADPLLLTGPERFEAPMSQFSLAVRSVQATPRICVARKHARPASLFAAWEACDHPRL
jgi:hypothetical protein